jgi:hypothetical protein
LDRQPDGAGTVPADLHRRSAHRAVLRLAQHLPTCPCLQAGDVCAVPQVRTAYKVIFWIVAALVLVALAFPYVLPLFY